MTIQLLKSGCSIAKSLDNTVNKVIIGHDGRNRMRNLESLIEGINSIIITKYLFRAIFTFIASNFVQNNSGDAIGIEITALNPYLDNGIKIFNTDGYKISSALERKIEEIIATQRCQQSFNY